MGKKPNLWLKNFRNNYNVLREVEIISAGLKVLETKSVGFFLEILFSSVANFCCGEKKKTKEKERKKKEIKITFLFR